MNQKGCLCFVTAKRKHLCAILSCRMIPRGGINENNIEIILSKLPQGKSAFRYSIYLPVAVFLRQHAHVRKIGMAHGVYACRYLLSKEDGG